MLKTNPLRSESPRPAPLIKGVVRRFIAAGYYSQVDRREQARDRGCPVPIHQEGSLPTPLTIPILGTDKGAGGLRLEPWTGSVDSGLPLIRGPGG